MRTYKKQHGGTFTYYLVIIVILFALMYGYSRVFRSELHDKANDFQSHHIKNGSVVAQIRYLKWYDNDNSTSYYIFTEKGKLYVDGSNHYSWWNSDEKFFDVLEEHEGMFCTMNVEDSFWNSWSVTQIINCVEPDIFYQNVKDGIINSDGEKYINNDVPLSTPIESDVPDSSPVKSNYSDIPD
jgi:hypothetical protein